MFKKNKILHQKWDLVQYQNQLFFKCPYHLANQSQLMFISNIYTKHLLLKCFLL